MKKTVLSTLGLLALVFSAYAQSDNDNQIDYTNVRDGEQVEYCFTHKKHAEMMATNPDYAASWEQDMQIRQQEKANGTAIPKATVYYIPVVFHLLHNNGIEKITDEQILDALDILNRDYALLNNDHNNVHNDFNLSNPQAVATPTSVDIQFRLATKAPNGQCFSGITHTENAISNDGSNGGAQVQAIANGNDVYNGSWPGDMYLNVFICGDIGGAAGYTYRPSNWVGAGMGNGIWILHNYVGSLGTSSTYTSRTLTHEVGHWLNLPHPWGSTNNPGLASNCNTDDSDDAFFINDTPNTIGVTSCNLNESTCGPRANVENYMDYSYCSKMFTQGQVDEMRNTIFSNVANRDNLITQANLQATGADGSPAYLCKAEFTADRTTICAGDTVNFLDESFNAVSGWTWTFAGGSPASSTDQNPSVSYDTPGLYTVTLQATDGGTNDTETKTSYIRVLPAAASLPFHEGFEDLTTLTNIEEWEVFNPAGAGFSIHTGTGHTGNKCAKLQNFGQSAGQTDELISSPVDLSVIDPNTGEVTLTFRYAYHKRYDSNDEWLKVFITGDCGESWAQRKTLHGDFLGNIAQNSSWTPSNQADWVTVHMTNVTSAYYVNNFRYKFEFESDGGNNFYLDDINIYSGPPSDQIVAVTENELDIDALGIYPNPADDELNVRFSIAAADQATLTIQDVSGKIVKATAVNANAGTNLVMLGTEQLSAGMYFLNVQVGGAQQTIQFVIK